MSGLLVIDCIKVICKIDRDLVVASDSAKSISHIQTRSFDMREIKYAQNGPQCSAAEQKLLELAAAS